MPTKGGVGWCPTPSTIEPVLTCAILPHLFCSGAIAEGRTAFALETALLVADASCPQIRELLRAAEAPVLARWPGAAAAGRESRPGPAPASRQAGGNSALAELWQSGTTAGWCHCDKLRHLGGQCSQPYQLGD